MKTILKSLNSLFVLLLLLTIVTSCEEDVKVSAITLDKVSADVMIGANLGLAECTLTVRKGILLHRQP
jgi:hypothetical protein